MPLTFFLWRLLESRSTVLSELLFYFCFIYIFCIGFSEQDQADSLIYRVTPFECQLPACCTNASRYGPQVSHCPKVRYVLLNVLHRTVQVVQSCTVCTCSRGPSSVECVCRGRRTTVLLWDPPFYALLLYITWCRHIHRIRGIFPLEKRVHPSPA